MKVLFLARYLPQEGSTTHMYTLARGLIDRGHEVHMISSGPKQDESAIRIFNEMIEYGMKHHKVWFPLDPGFNLAGKVKQLLQYMITTPRTLYTMIKIKPDIVHIHYPVTSYIGKIYKLLTGKKFIVTHHTVGIPKHILNKKADYVIAISKELEEELKVNYNYKEDQIRLIYNGVSESKFSKNISYQQKLCIKQELGLQEGKVIIGFAGTHNFNKGIDVLLKACSYIRDNNFQIILVGDGDKEWVKELAIKLNIQDKVKLYPFQDISKFYSIMDIFVLPSRKEGFSLVSIESMMMKIPTIRSNCGGAYDQIDHGLNGYIFENEDDKELYRYILDLLNDKDLRLRIGKQANKKAINNFTQDIMVNKVLDLYNDVKIKNNVYKGIDR